MFLPSRSQDAWGILERAKPCDRRMCDSPVMPSQSDSTSKILYSEVTYDNSKTQEDLADEVWSTSSSLEANNVNEEAGSFASCIRSSNPYPYRIQLERDVRRLQQQLQEEMEMHAILESAIEKNTVKLFSPSCLPHHFEQAQELLSTIAVLEVTVTKLEQEIVSLHFQLSQERNERRLAEYRLRQSASQSLSAYSFDSMKEEISSSSSRSLKHSDYELHQSEKNNSCKHQASESTGETSSAQSLMEDSMKAPELFHEKKVSVQTDAKPIQPAELMRLPKGMPPKGLWDYPNQLSEEMVRCMKNIFLSLADSAVPSMSSALESQSSPVSPRGHLSSSSWWSSSERSMISSWVQSPQIDIQSNSEVLALGSVFDPYKVHGKLSWADIGNYGLATEVSWMSVGKKQLEYASGALRKFRYKSFK